MPPPKPIKPNHDDITITSGNVITLFNRL